MAVYYKFKSAKDFDSIPIYGNFVSVADFKELVFKSKYVGNGGTDFDLLVTNAQNNLEYVDDKMMIPNGTSLLVRRVPGLPRMRITVPQDKLTNTKAKLDDVPQQESSLMKDESSGLNYGRECGFDDFGDDIYPTPEMPLAIFGTAVVEQSDCGLTNEEEEKKIRELVEITAVDRNCQRVVHFGASGGYEGTSARNFGLLERRKPPVGYVCHRCKVPGHFIQHCPTNGDPNYDVKKLRPPTGVPTSMLVASSDGSYSLPSGMVAVLTPNEYAFEKEIQGLPSTCPVVDHPPELLCPLCKRVMKDAVLTSKCCFRSFCDKCIRDRAISCKTCVCGAANLFADDLIPNKTLRQTISRISESSSSSSAVKSVNSIHVQGVESALPTQPKLQPPTASSTKEDHASVCISKLKGDLKESRQGGDSAIAQSLEKNVSAENLFKTKVEPVSENMKTSQKGQSGAAEAQEKQLLSQQVKKRKKASVPPIAPFSESAYDPYYGSMPWNLNGHMAGFPSAIPFLGYTSNPYDGTAGVFPPNPFWAQACMMQNHLYQSNPLVNSGIHTTSFPKQKLVPDRFGRVQRSAETPDGSMKAYNLRSPSPAVTGRQCRDEARSCGPKHESSHSEDVNRRPIDGASRGSHRRERWANEEIRPIKGPSGRDMVHDGYSSDSDDEDRHFKRRRQRKEAVDGKGYADDLRLSRERSAGGGDGLLRGQSKPESRKAVVI